MHNDYSRIIDLSHTIEDGLITYKGLPAPLVCDYWSREQSKFNFTDGSSFHIGKIEMVTNTGTYLDCPFHRFEDGKDLSEIALEKFVDLEGIVIRVPYEHSLSVTKDHLEKYELKNKAVLIHTGWDQHWNTPAYYENHPFLTAEAALYLKECEVVLVGIDSHNIDDTNGTTRPVHTTLLRHDILIVEHLCNLDMITEEGFLFSAVPPKFKGIGTFPVRALAKIKN